MGWRLPFPCTGRRRRHLSSPTRLKGAIMTVGLTDVPLTYSLRQIQPDFAALLCTPGSAATTDKVLADFPLAPSRTRRREVADDPAEIGRLIHEFYECFLWLRDQCQLAPSDIQVDPTAGRKWMSAGAYHDRFFSRPEHVLRRGPDARRAAGARDGALRRPGKCL